MYAYRSGSDLEGLPLGVVSRCFTDHAVYIDPQSYLSNSRTGLGDEVIAIRKRQTLLPTYSHDSRPCYHHNTCSDSLRDTMTMNSST